MRSLLLLLIVAVPSALAGQPTKRSTDEERGEELWLRHCQACHGPGNRGDGPAAEALVAKVPDLRGKVKADDATVKVVLRGKASMPGYETTFIEPKADTRRVLNYMATVHSKGSTQKPVKKPAAPKPVEPADAQDAQGGGQ